MGLRDLKKRWTTSVEDLHNARLQERFAVNGTTAIGEAPHRVPIRLAGEVTRQRLVPRSGTPALEVVLTDGTGDAYAVFTGRRAIAGLECGRALIIEGVGHEDRGHLTLLNPAYTFIPGADEH